LPFKHEGEVVKSFKTLTKQIQGFLDVDKGKGLYDYIPEAAMKNGQQSSGAVL